MWIEIPVSPDHFLAVGSRPARALWIEIPHYSNFREGLQSRPARALWIEIYAQSVQNMKNAVEAREGLVD